MLKPASSSEQNIGAAEPTVIFLLIVTFYVISKLVIFSVEESFLIRDTLLNLPRLLCAVAAGIYGLRTFGPFKMGFHLNGAKIFYIILLAEIFSLGAYGLLTHGPLPSYKGILIFAASGLVVSLFEEVVFRGLGIASLTNWKSHKTAIWTTSILFTAIHFGNQPLTVFPAIFFFGILMSLMRIAGISLLFLIITHTAYDFLWLFLVRNEGPNFGWILYDLTSLIPLLIFCLVSKKKRLTLPT